MTGGASGKAVKATEDARAPSKRCGTRSFLAIFLLDCWIFLTLFGFAIGLGGLGLDGGVEAMTESDRPSGEGAVREISRRYDGVAAGGESREDGHQDPRGRSLIRTLGLGLGSYRSLSMDLYLGR